MTTTWNKTRSGSSDGSVDTDAPVDETYFIHHVTQDFLDLGTGAVEVALDEVYQVSGPDEAEYIRTDVWETSETPSSRDPWTIVKLASDFDTTATTGQTTALGFTPAASTQYVFEAYLAISTDTATNGVRPGIRFPSGVVFSIARSEAPTSATASAIRFWGPDSDNGAASTGLASADESWFAKIEGMFKTDSAPSGDCYVSIKAEAGGGGGTITLLAGSVLMYRTV